MRAIRGNNATNYQLRLRIRSMRKKSQPKSDSWVILSCVIWLRISIAFCNLWKLCNWVQTGLAINDNYSTWLSHHQKLSSDGQKSSRHIRLDMLNRFVKGISVKIVWRCHTEKRVFGPTINLNSKLGGFISILINYTPKRQFLTRLSCVIVYLSQPERGRTSN